MENIFKKEPGDKNQTNNCDDDNVIIIDDSPEANKRSNAGIKEFLLPILERKYQRDPFIPVYHRSEEGKRLEEEVERKDIEKKLKLKKTQHYRQIREEKSKTKNRMISLGLPTIKA